MHLNWERLSLSGYFEALEAHNESASGEKSATPSDPERLRRFVEARRG
jgi:hypothetical protein